MAQQNVKHRSGNRILVFFDGKQVGSVQSVRMSDDYAPEPASGIGDAHATEYVPGMARHVLNVSAMVLNRGSLMDQGITPENADAVLQGIVFDFEAHSKDDGTLVRKYRGCSYASGELEVSKHAIVMHSAVFNALDVSGVNGGV